MRLSEVHKDHQAPPAVDKCCVPIAGELSSSFLASVAEMIQEIQEQASGRLLRGGGELNEQRVSSLPRNCPECCLCLPPPLLSASSVLHAVCDRG